MWTRSRTITAVALAGLVSAGAASAYAQSQADGAVYYRPGAPGEPGQRLSLAEVSVLASPYTQADVEFVQHMIPHHGQALTMTAMVPADASDAVRITAQRIAIVQESEIDRMQQWLRLRGQHVPEPHEHHDGELMPGMLTEDQLAQLDAATGSEFDRLFLEFMIFHHQGALAMVGELEDTPGTALDADLAALVNQLYTDQLSEILRMQRLLEELG